MTALEVVRCTGMVALIAALPLILAAALIESPWWLATLPLWIAAQWATRPGARLSVWRID